MDGKRKNFREVFESLQDLCVSVTNCAGKIVVSVYDSVSGETILPDTLMTIWSAVRLFGDLTIYSTDVVESGMCFTLNAPEEPSEESEPFT